MTRPADEHGPMHAARPLKREEHWPEGVYTISLDSLDRLGVDAEGILYFDGSPIKTSRTVTLERRERWIAYVVAAASVVAALATAAQAYAALVLD